MRRWGILLHGEGYKMIIVSASIAKFPALLSVRLLSFLYYLKHVLHLGRTCPCTCPKSVSWNSFYALLYSQLTTMNLTWEIHHLSHVKSRNVRYKDKNQTTVSTMRHPSRLCIRKVRA